MKIKNPITTITGILALIVGILATIFPDLASEIGGTKDYVLSIITAVMGIIGIWSAKDSISGENL